MTALSNFTGFIDINDHGLLLLKGPDAKKFLQGQVTCDIDELLIDNNNTCKSILGAHCTHKGRMLFSFRACLLDEQTIALSIIKPLLSSALAALKKYSIFSKVELIDASEDYRIIGYIGSDITSLQAIFNDAAPQASPDTPNASITDNGLIIRVNPNRYEVWLKHDQFESITNKIEGLSDNKLWTMANIQDGIGEVYPQTTEEFIPQMLNFQVVGEAISFSKGCYTGQEVVARMKYLGKLKRHMYRFAINNDQVIDPGAPLYTAEKQQSIGNVVIAAVAGNSQELLAVATEEAVNSDEIYIDPNYQQKLQILKLPYAITKE